MSIFATTNVANVTKETEPNTPPETPPPDTPPESPPESPVVKLPDGSEVPADTYVSQQLNEEKAKINSEWDRVRQAAVQQLAPQASDPPPAPSDPTWKVAVESDDAYQSDVEKTLVNSHNALGSEVTNIHETVSDTQRKIESLEESIAAEKAQRQIQQIQQSKGVSESELEKIYNEFNGEVNNLDVLAEVALSRKSADELSQERIQQANENRKQAASVVSGGGDGTPVAEPNEPKGRGLNGKDRYSGAAIAAKYKAF